MPASMVDLIRCVLRDLYSDGVIDEYQVHRGMSRKDSSENLVRDWGVVIGPARTGFGLCVRLYRDAVSVCDETRFTSVTWVPLGHASSDWMPALAKYVRELVEPVPVEVVELPALSALDQILGEAYYP